MKAIAEVIDTDALQAMAHPMRLRILAALREPDSAAAVARGLGQPRQKVNYHVKELERAGLARRVGERRAGNLVESLYQATAATYVVSPRLAWVDRPRIDALAEQVALENLVSVGERLQQAAALLLDRAAFDGEKIASAAVETEVRFADAAQRKAFLAEYVSAIGPLLKKYGDSQGDSYRVVLAVHPDSKETS
ncbi:winged helix-turn-helix domain-containing protein [Kibdelosporangium phytohabitans]|uniref:winged helix-turn-helix domain-containing protein n=1 Tax=Kibdelosporangium phytohabitans TaxID=860235 RepID=UPI00147017F6|nr:helix-turn-helix domain-containing protein [Kibdelosporangium phytohabitans]MBE1462543.1 DNA-binding transcriptional ArsR family regulator [Kibdelosporangium phytohabitans]